MTSAAIFGCCEECASFSGRTTWRARRDSNPQPSDPKFHCLLSAVVHLVVNRAAFHLLNDHSAHVRPPLFGAVAVKLAVKSRRSRRRHARHSSSVVLLPLLRRARGIDGGRGPSRSYYP
jgi:hypothetical protein